MILEIHPNSNKPIYEQLILEIKKGVVTGQLMPGESMPSVRILASDIGINMHTVNKVYKHLQNENILVKEKNGFAVNPKGMPNATMELGETFEQKLYEVILEKELRKISDESMTAMIKSIQKKLLNK